MVPSRVLAMTLRLSESLASPVTHLSLRFEFVASTTPSGGGPRSNDFRLMPDCMLYMYIAPVEEDAIPKLPHADTHVA